MAVESLGTAYMTKYEKLYGVGITHFPNEKENVKEKLRLSKAKMYEYYLNPPTTHEDKLLEFEVKQAVQWCEKILGDIDE